MERAQEATRSSELATGVVKKAFGNLLEVQVEGDIRQGEVASVCVGSERLKAEVIEIVGCYCKLQVFEDTRGVSCGTKVQFHGELLEAELGPGLLSAVFDGLQNPLQDLSKQAGTFLPRGLYLPSLDREMHWDFHPTASVGDTVSAGDELGFVHEHRFRHAIMVPFSYKGSFQICSLAQEGSYKVDAVIAKLSDENGVEHDVTMVQKWPIKKPLAFGERTLPKKMLDTGLRIIDTQFPLLKGGTFCTPGPFGAGKTVLQHHLSKFSAVDIVVVAACGERAGEVVEILREFPHLTDPHTGDPLIKRTAIICNTSSMPVAARESSIYLGVTIAEYYRQMGLDVLLLADSTSRWAQALREMSGRLEEIPGDEAFPAYLASRIAEFYQRAGVLQLKGDKLGSLTIGGAVSPAGGNFEEPVTQATLAVVNTFLGLSRSRSDSRRYPAIDPLISWSKSIEQVAKFLGGKSPSWGRFVKKAQKILEQGDEIGKRMEVVGEEGIALDELITYLKAELFDHCYLQQNAFDKEDAYCPLSRQIELFTLINEIFSDSYSLQSHDKARTLFLNIQSQIKNRNFLPIDSAEYARATEKLMATLKAAKQSSEAE